jgi:hypothetical protein
VRRRCRRSRRSEKQLSVKTRHPYTPMASSISFNLFSSSPPPLLFHFNVHESDKNKLLPT